MITAEEARANNKLARECEGLQSAVNAAIAAAIDCGERSTEHYTQTSRFAVASTENVLEACGYDFRVTELGRYIEVRNNQNVTMVRARFEIEW